MATLLLALGRRHHRHGCNSGAAIVLALAVAWLLLAGFTATAAASRQGKHNATMWSRANARRHSSKSNITAVEATMKPSRPRRPKVPSNSTGSGGGQTNGPVPGVPVEAFTGVASNVSVDQLPDIKPDGVPHDPRYRAAKRA